VATEDGLTTYIALLRGINVGGKAKLPMKELSALLGELGCASVRTYIQSGNVVFQRAEADRSRLSRQIAAEIGRRHGFTPEILLLGPDELERAMTSNPFPEAESEPTSLHLGFLVSAPSDPDLDTLEALKSESERFRLIDAVFYLHAPAGIGRSRLAARAERLLGVPMTDRNWRTVAKLREMVHELHGANPGG
jgi:uncharacterized protein (DUF1697 family)